LKKQIEEKERLKKLEKLKEKELAEKEEQRIKREREELAKSKDYQTQRTKQITEQKRNLFNPSEDNSLARHIISKNRELEAKDNVVSSFKQPQEIIDEYKKEVKTHIEEPINTYPEVNNVFTPPVELPYNNLMPVLPKANYMGDVINPLVGKKIEDYNELMNYKKQIDALLEERLRAKEEALKYREQLNKEREMRIQQMLMNCNPKNQTVVEPSLNISKIQVSEQSVIDPIAKKDSTMEKSLASDVKWVKVTQSIDPHKDFNELYKTWKCEDLVEKPRMVEIALQTINAPNTAVASATEDNERQSDKDSASKSLSIESRCLFR
jgi:hypothetical protein